MSKSNDFLLTDWTETAFWYVEQYGWEVIPLHPNPKFARQGSKDPAVRHVGYDPLAENWKEEASSNPAIIREWADLTTESGKRLPHVFLGVKTGRDSNLLVLEVALDGRGEEQLKKWQQAETSLPSTATLFEGRDRKFYFFTYPDGVDDLPRWFGGPSLRLHGESSLVRIPILNKRRSKLTWDLQGPEDPAPPPSWLLARFGCLFPEDNPLAEDPSAPQTNDALNGNPSIEKKDHVVGNGLHDPSPVSTESGGDLKTQMSPTKNLPIRTGDDLVDESSEEEPFLGHPWLVEDGLTVLAGPPKITGKTTWTLNVAAHLVAGRDFMGFPSQTCPVVLLTDVPAKWTRVLLRDLDLNDSTARSRLHVIHPKEVADWHWTRLLEHTYRYAEKIGAKAVFIDSLDQYVGVQGGPDPTSSDRVLHQLSMQSPSETAVFAVKATQSNSLYDVGRTLDELSALGATADVVIDMARVKSSPRSTLRRFVTLARAGDAPIEMYGDMEQGRYSRIPRERFSEEEWIPSISGDSSPRDSRSPVAPFRTQDREEGVSVKG